MGDGDADGAAPDMAVGGDEAGQEVVIFARSLCRFSAERR